MFNLFNKPVSDIYYYKCGTNNKTNQHVCTKSQTGFKEFDKPEEYKNIIHIALNKETVERISSITHPYADNFWPYWQRESKAEKGEIRILTAEIGTDNFNIIEK